MAVLKLSLLAGIALDLPQVVIPRLDTISTCLASLLPSALAPGQDSHSASASLPQTTLPVESAGPRQTVSMNVAQAAESAPSPQPAAAPAAPAQVGTAQQSATPPANGDALNHEILQRKQDELVRREQELRQLQHQVDTRLADLQQLEVRIQAMIKEAEGMKDSKFRHLVDVYSNMKAKQAAAVLETLDERIAVKILAGMRGRQAGEVLTYATPEKAARLSEALTRMQLPVE